MAEKVMTAPLAVIKIGGVPVGKIKSIRCTENITRQPVVGIGKLAPEELPPLRWNGVLNAGFYTIDLRQAPLPGALNRVAQTVDEWENFLTLNTQGLQIDILRKVAGPANLLSGFSQPTYEIFASVKGCFATRESWDISEMQISGRDMDFEYITPILFPF